MLRFQHKLAQTTNRLGTRCFASAPIIDMQQQAHQETPVTDFAETYYTPKSQNLAAAKRRTGPVLPHFDYATPKYMGPSYEELKEMRMNHVSPASFHFYKEPLLIVDGFMQYLFDHTGKRYLDYISGISTVGLGHCHPRVTAAMKAQMDRVQHLSTIYMNDQHSLYAQELAAKLPEGLDCVYFTSSGSEANAMATMFARMHTGNHPIINLKNAYHGHAGSQHLSNVSNWSHNLPRTQGVETSCYPDLFRGPYSAKDAPKRYADQLKECIDFNTSGDVALFMVEPVQGAGGINPIPDGFMQHAIPHIREAGGLLLSDEVQTAFGRMGSHYWGCEMLGYKPDIVTMAKHIGNGIPLGAVATTKEIASSLKKTTFTTYGSNPIAMAAGRECLKIVDEEGLQEKARQSGQLLWEGFRPLVSKYEQVGDVRGRGIMMGIEIVKDKESKIPDLALFTEIFERTKNYGLLLGKGGRFGNVFRIQPSMAITEADIEFSVDVFDRSVRESLFALNK